MYKKFLKETEPASSAVRDRRMRNNSHKLKQQEDLSGNKEKLFNHEGSEPLECVAQRSYVVSILGDFQDWT